MTVTLEIPLEIEVGLRHRAKEFGLDLSEYLVSLAEADINEDYSLAQADIESIQQGLEELHAGDKGMLLEDYRAEVMAEYHRRKLQGSQSAK